MEIPALRGNWVDFFIILVLLFYLWDGVEKGFFSGLFELFSFLASFFVSLKLYPLAASFLISNFSFPHGIANALGFFLVGFLAESLFYLLVQFFYQKIPERLKISVLDHLFGFLPAVGSGLTICAFLLTLFVSLPLAPNIKADILSSKIGGPLVLRTSRFEKALKDVFGEALEESLTFITVPEGGEERVDLNFKLTKFWVDQESERKMLTLLNSERKRKGLPALAWEESLAKVARAHAKDMFSRGYFSHYTPEGVSPFERLERSGVSFTVGGENLALAPTVLLAHQGLMASPGHRENILSPQFSKVGIGVIDGGVYGKMFVQEFTD